MNIQQLPFLKNLKETEIFEKNKDQIREMNRDAIGAYILLGFAISLITIVLQLIILRLGSFYQGLALFVYFVLAEILYRTVMVNDLKHATIYVYLVQMPVLVFAILMGTVFDSGTVTFTFIPLVVGFPLFILDRPRNVHCYLTGLVVLYIALCLIAKPFSVASVDLIHLSVYGAVAYGASMFVLSSRIEIVKKTIAYKGDSEHDPLTGVYNRRGGEERICACVKNKVPGLLILLDVDDFKSVNDSYGHSEGDALLESVSAALKKSFRADDTVMRTGGDEFVIYAPHLIDRADVKNRLHALNHDLAELGGSDNKQGYATVSMGAVINDGSWPSYELLYREADRLLYEEKQKGKNGFCLRERPHADDELA